VNFKNSIQELNMEEDCGVEKQRDLLSCHKTVAEFKGLEEMQCRHMTMLCPDRCGHGGTIASFKIKNYVHYEKPGEYGDEKTNVYHVKLSDSVASTGLTAERRAVLDSLKTGDEVELEWNHDYVTTEYEGGCSSSSPERPITHLAKK